MLQWRQNMFHSLEDERSEHSRWKKVDKYCNKMKSRDEFFCIYLSKGTGLVDVFLSLNRIECLPQKIWMFMFSFEVNIEFEAAIVYRPDTI